MVAEGIAPTLLGEPPKRQTLVGTSLDWEKCPAPSNATELLAAVTRVRNNLVHGGKSGDPDSDRNDRLIAESIAVMLAIVRTSDVLYMRIGSRRTSLLECTLCVQ